MPQLAATVFKLLARRWMGVMTGLALTRLANAPSQASIALSGVLVSFSLMVAMAIMVSSFRTSVDTWLQQLLSADMYVRTVSGGEQSVLQVHELVKHFVHHHSQCVHTYRRIVIAVTMYQLKCESSIP